MEVKGICYTKRSFLSSRSDYMRRNRFPIKAIIALIFAIACIVFLYLWISSWFSPERKAENVLKSFYEYEQNGQFASSWELFHSEMQNKWDKSEYIQDRAHVFINHFGVDTFEFEYTEPVKLDTWKMSDQSPSLSNVYQFTVILGYESKYGYLEIQQPVYITEEKENWVILWDYN